MKKFYAFLAAALMSVSVFAAKDVVPSDEVLADYYTPGQVCVCIYVPNTMNCYDVVLTGTYNDWSGDAAQCAKFVAVDGYDDWYVVAVDDDGLNAKGEAYESLQEKPVMLDGDGKFDWEYQVGAATKVRGGVTVVEGAYAGEIDLKTYGTDAPNVFTVDGWKKNPCTAVYHNYHFEVVSDGCGGLVVPYVIGALNGWSFERMQLDVDKTMALGVPVYYLNKKCAEETPFQFVSGLMNAETGEIEVEPDWVEAAYVQQLIDEQWVRIPGESGDNLLTHADANITLDLREETLRWARCAPDEREDVVVTLIAPAGAPAEGVDVIGSFDDWKGTLMTKVEEGKYTATVRMQASDEFKFRRAADADWKVQIQQPDPDPESQTGWKDMGNLKVEDYWDDAVTPKTIDIDLSDAAEYRWTPVEQGIENITLTEQAQKVVVDGVLYIVRDNKMFNVQGTQVR